MIPGPSNKLANVLTCYELRTLIMRQHLSRRNTLESERLSSDGLTLIFPSCMIF